MDDLEVKEGLEPADADFGDEQSGELHDSQPLVPPERSIGVTLWGNELKARLGTRQGATGYETKNTLSSTSSSDDDSTYTSNSSLRSNPRDFLSTRANILPEQPSSRRTPKGKRLSLVPPRNQARFSFGAEKPDMDAPDSKLKPKLDKSSTKEKSDDDDWEDEDSSTKDEINKIRYPKNLTRYNPTIPLPSKAKGRKTSARYRTWFCEGCGRGYSEAHKEGHQKKCGMPSYSTMAETSFPTKLYSTQNSSPENSSQEGSRPAIQGRFETNPQLNSPSDYPKATDTMHQSWVCTNCGKGFHRNYKKTHQQVCSGQLSPRARPPQVVKSRIRKRTGPLEIATSGAPWERDSVGSSWSSSSPEPEKESTGVELSYSNLLTMDLDSDSYFSYSPLATPDLALFDLPLRDLPLRDLSLLDLKLPLLDPPLSSLPSPGLFAELDPPSPSEDNKDALIPQGITPASADNRVLFVDLQPQIETVPVDMEESKGGSPVDRKPEERAETSGDPSVLEPESSDHSLIDTDIALLNRSLAEFSCAQPLPLNVNETLQHRRVDRCKDSNDALLSQNIKETNSPPMPGAFPSLADDQPPELGEAPASHYSEASEHTVDQQRTLDPEAVALDTGLCGTTICDKLKLFAEGLFRLPILWWPLLQPCPVGSVRMKWICSCGKSVLFCASSELARDYMQHYPSRVHPASAPTPSPHNVPNQSSNASSSSTNNTIQNAQTTPSQAVSQNSSGSKKTLRSRLLGWAPPSNRSHPSQNNIQMSSDYVIFYVPGTLKLPQCVLLPEKHYRTDSAFFHDMRSVYCSINQTWNPFKCLAELKFFKLERYYDKISCPKEEIPVCTNSKYEYNPSNIPTPPIPAEVMLHLFNEPPSSSVHDEGLIDRIPKRVKNGPVPNREKIAWGVVAFQGLSFSRGVVGILIALVAMFAAGACFAGYWLATGSGGLQDAFVPLQVIIGIVGAIAIPLGIMQLYEQRKIYVL